MSDDFHPWDEESEDTKVEISDLPTSQKQASSRLARAMSWLERRWLFAPGRRKRHGLFMVVCCVVLLGLVLAANILLIQPFASRQQPVVHAPQASPSSEAGFFAFQQLPTWGSLTIDQRHIASPPQPGEQPLHLSPGRHILIWNVPPFKTFRCVLAVLPARSSEAQACATRELGRTAYALSTQLVLLPDSLADLPTNQREALVGAVQRLLDTRKVVENVQMGERYAFVEAPDQILTASRPLTAIERLVLDTTATATPARCDGVSLATDHTCNLEGQDCRLFCTLTRWPRLQPEMPQWNIAAIFHVERTYVLPSGERLQAPSGQDTTREQFVTLRVSWLKSQWSVSFHTQGESTFDEPTCLSMVSLLMSGRGYMTRPGTTQPFSWLYYVKPERTASCLATSIQQNSSPPAPGTLQLLWRFGVLSTLTTQAQERWPELPSASAQGQAIAQQLLRSR